MPLLIDDEQGVMVLEGTDARADRLPDGRWTVTGRDGSYTRNQAVTAMTLAELYAAGRDANDPLVRDLETELEANGA